MHRCDAVSLPLKWDTAHFYISPNPNLTLFFSLYLSICLDACCLHLCFTRLPVYLFPSVCSTCLLLVHIPVKSLCGFHRVKKGQAPLAHLMF